MFIWLLYISLDGWIQLRSLTMLLLVSLWPSFLAFGLLVTLGYELLKDHSGRLFIVLILREGWSMIWGILSRFVRSVSRHIQIILQYLRRSQTMSSVTKASGILTLLVLSFVVGRQYQKKQSFEFGFIAGQTFEDKALRSGKGHLENMFIVDRPTAWSILYRLPKTGDTILRADVCPDYVAPPLDIQPGMTVCMDFFDRGNCISINPHLGAWYSIKKDLEGNYVRLANNSQR